MTCFGGVGGWGVSTGQTPPLDCKGIGFCGHRAAGEAGVGPV